MALCCSALALAASCRAGDATPPSRPQPTAGSAAAAGSAVASPAAGEPRPGSPDSRDGGPAARQLAAWLAAFNTGDRAALLAYHQQSFPYEAASADVGNIERELGLAQGTGGFELMQTEDAAPTRVAVLLKERDSDQFAHVELEVDAAAPNRVHRFEIHPVPTPERFRPRRMSEADALAALRAEIARAVAADRFSGAVLVAHNGTPILAEAYGLADRERKVPNTLDTRFRIGSMNKMFTAVATLQLVQAGKLSLTAPIGKVLRDYPNAGIASKVTLHHLLTHTGGTGDFFGPEFDQHRLELRTHADYLKLFGKRDLGFEPGAQWAYSNYGFLLLGAIIERATRQSYYDWVSARVYTPAGMTGTASPPEDGPGPNRSVPYTRETATAPWTSAANTLPYRGTSAGGGDSTVTDLLRFANALTGHKLLDAAHTALLTTGKVERRPGLKYAYGFSDEVTDGVRCFGHGGGAPGMNGQLTICESGYTIAVLANLDPPAAGRFADFLVRRLPAK